MLTDTKLRNLKPTGKLYKVADRDGLYVAVTPSGTISFRYNYALNGRQETITFGRYGPGGITLAEAKKMIAAGKSPAREKAREKARVRDAETFGAWAEKWLRSYQMAESTRDMRRSVYERDLKAKFGNLKLTEINFSKALWTIPKERRKRRNQHLVFGGLSTYCLRCDWLGLDASFSFSKISFALKLPPKVIKYPPQPALIRKLHSRKLEIKRCAFSGDDFHYDLISIVIFLGQANQGG